jgi:hypothetical protein
LGERRARQWGKIERTHRAHDRLPEERPRTGPASQGGRMKALKIVGVILAITLAALIIVPLIVLAGLFVWLKLTEEADEEALELEQETA